MPPKRKSPARRVAAGKKAQIAVSSKVVPLPTTPSGRPRRSVAGDINYKLTATRAPNGTVEKLAKVYQDAPGTKAVKETASETPKRRGRPPKAAAIETATSTKKIPSATAATGATAASAAKAVRGRPSKAAVPAAPVTTNLAKRKRGEEEQVAAPAKKRGRPAKIATNTTSGQVRNPLASRVQKDATASKPVVKPKVTTKSAAKPATTTTPAKRGRPKGATSVKSASAPNTTTKRGPKPKSKNHAQTETEAIDEGLTQAMDLDAEVGDTQYWLMKAEPDDRYVKGINVAFSIDKLAQATEPEPWDGVRNPVARNCMRAMRKGDLAFFYHSSCSVPGIVGVMRVAEEHSIDDSAFDPTHPYYDEKSVREKPKWDCVKVEYVKRFTDIITLKELKSTPELAAMKVAQKAYGRLSVQSVTPDQWRFVLKMANEPEDLGATAAVSGYEADTNGETDKEAVDESVGGDGLDDQDNQDDIDADNLAAYGVSDEVDDEEAEYPVIPETNGHAIPEMIPEPNHSQDRDQDDMMVPGEQN